MQKLKASFVSFLENGKLTGGTHMYTTIYVWACVLKTNVLNISITFVVM